MPRTLAIGDVHGCLSSLQAVLNAAAPGPQDTILTLGDYIDRGPRSPGVLEFLLRLSRIHKLIALKGNHEQMLLGARSHPGILRDWMLNGGDATLRAYARAKIGLPQPGQPAQPAAHHGRLQLSLNDIPEEHWRFMASLPLYHETNTHIFVHGGADSILSMEEQEEAVILWQRFDAALPHVSGKTLICGHTPGPVPRDLGFAICLDTGAFRPGGYLTCYEVETGRVIQANARGHVRQSHITDYRLDAA